MQFVCHLKACMTCLASFGKAASMASDANTQTLTGAQLRAARALINISGEELAEKTALGLSTIRRAEAEDGPVSLTRANTLLIRTTLEALGVQFLDAEKSGGAGVRLAIKPPQKRRASDR